MRELLDQMQAEEDQVRLVRIQNDINTIQSNWQDLGGGRKDTGSRIIHMRPGDNTFYVDDKDIMRRGIERGTHNYSGEYGDI